MDWVEKLLRKKKVIEFVYVFPLISTVFIGISLKGFVNIHAKMAGIAEIRHLFLIVLALLFVNLVANFIGLTLYFCLFNRIRDFLQNYKKKPA